MARPVNQRKRREWQRRLKRFENTRRSVAAFCRQEGVSEPSFYHWRKRLTSYPAQGGASTADVPSGFRAVRLLGATSVTVHLPGGTRLEVPTADPQALRVVVSTLADVDTPRGGGRPC
jgi:hypothetical protein